jgi:hypothetical protein
MDEERFQRSSPGQLGQAQHDGTPYFAFVPDLPPRRYVARQILDIVQ